MNKTKALRGLAVKFGLDPELADTELAGIIAAMADAGEIVGKNGGTVDPKKTKLSDMQLSITVTPELRDWLIDRGELEAADDEVMAYRAQKAVERGELSLDGLRELMGRQVTKQKGQGQGMLTNPTAEQAFGGGKSGTVDVKDHSARYSDVRYPAKHYRTGQTVMGISGVEAQLPSQRDFAKYGAFLKWLWKGSRCNNSNIELTEHENGLIGELFTKETWCGMVGSNYEREIAPSRVKTLLSDSTSGGVNINPYFVDQNIITFALLYGELLPHVDLVEMPHGASTFGASIANPTVAWNNDSDGASLTPFNTAGLVAALDATVFDVTCSMIIGRNLLADTMVADLGSIVMNNIGKSMLKELDHVIAMGNGTSQPQGFNLASALTVIPSQMGMNNGNTWTLADLEGLLFGVPKQYVTAALRPAFVANQTTYQRIRGIPVGADDARRVLGPDEGSYNVLSWPFKIQQDIPNNYLAFLALSLYRLYRRAGQEMRFTDQGQTLFENNSVMYMCIGRYAGRLMNTQGAAIITDGPN
jgi:HK97 family phage major capsid protein